MSGWQSVILLSIGFTLLTACTSPAAPPPVAVQAVETPSVVSSLPISTATVVPTATAKPTQTAEVPATTTPTQTKTPRPTRTPAPTRTATQAPRATATIEPTLPPTVEPSATAASEPIATMPPIPTESAEPTPVAENPLGMIANLEEIPELDASYPNTDPTLMENAIKATFTERGYTITRDEQSGTGRILQFEQGDSIYAVRITPFEDGSGVVLEIRMTDADTAFAEVPEEEQLPASAFGLSLGDCVMPNQATQALDIVACDTPHYLEVVGVLEFPAETGAPFPTDDEWYDVFTYDCETAFVEYTGSGVFGPHDYWYTGFGPTPTSWATGDRQIICLLFHVENELLTYSARDEFKE